MTTKANQNKVLDLLIKIGRKTLKQTWTREQMKHWLSLGLRSAASGGAVDVESAYDNNPDGLKRDTKAATLIQSHDDAEFKLKERS